MSVRVQSFISTRVLPSLQSVRKCITVVGVIGLTAAVLSCVLTAANGILVGRSKVDGKLPYSVASANLFTDFIRFAVSLLLLLPEYLYNRLQRARRAKHQHDTAHELGQNAAAAAAAAAATAAASAVKHLSMRIDIPDKEPADAAFSYSSSSGCTTARTGAAIPNSSSEYGFESYEMTSHWQESGFVQGQESSASTPRRHEQIDGVAAGEDEEAAELQQDMLLLRQQEQQEQEEDMEQLAASMLSDESPASRNSSRSSQHGAFFAAAKPWLKYCLLYAAPCAAWWFAGFFSLQALGTVDPATHSLLGNSRILIVALLCRVILKQMLSTVQLFALCTLGIFVTVAQLSLQHAAASSGTSLPISTMMLGIFYILFAVSTGSLGGVLCELMMKKSKPAAGAAEPPACVQASVILQSTIIHAWMVVFHGMATLILDVIIPLASGQSPTVFSGWNMAGVSAIVIIACAGLLNIVQLATGGNFLSLFSGAFVLAVIYGYELVTSLMNTGAAQVNWVFVLAVVGMVSCIATYVHGKKVIT